MDQDPTEVALGRDCDPPEVRRVALRAIEGSKLLSATQQDRLERMLTTGDGVDDPLQLAKHIVATSDAAYRSAWAKILARQAQSVQHTQVERRALGRYLETRVATEGTNAAGGFGVPFDLDSAIVGTSGGLAAPVLDHCRRTVLTQGMAWHGVSSSLASGYGWVAEDGTFTDSSLTLAQPTLPVYKAAAVAPVSYELLQDYGGEGFQVEMAKILAQEFLTFMGLQTLQGTGSSQPYGIFPQLFNTTTNPAHIVSTSLGAPALVDVRNAWKALPDKFRYNAYWIMHPSMLSEIAALVSGGASMAELRYTHDGTPLLRGRPVIESEYAPAYVNTTASTQEFLALVDLSDGFLVANRVPTIVELTQTGQLTGTTPTMQKFLISTPRVAFGLLDPLFGVILANS